MFAGVVTVAAIVGALLGGCCGDNGGEVLAIIYGCAVWLQEGKSSGYWCARVTGWVGGTFNWQRWREGIALP